MRAGSLAPWMNTVIPRLLLQIQSRLKKSSAVGISQFVTDAGPDGSSTSLSKTFFADFPNEIESRFLIKNVLIDVGSFATPL